MSNTFSFKCYLESKDGGKEIRRFNLDSDVFGNFTYLQEKIRSIYPSLLRECFTIQYIDDEQDHVTISSDDEFVSALMYMKREPSEPFRLIVKFQGAKPKAEITNTGNCQGNAHVGITCDGCQGPVKGFRYKCFQCPDFDLCGKCEAGGFHPGHIMLRVTGVLPPAYAGMKQLLVGGQQEVPHWRKKHHGRSYCGVGPHHGRWNAWCPSGVDIDPSETNGTKKEEKKDEKKPECPFKTNVDHAKKAAEAFQETAPDFLMGIGSTIATILSQIGVNTEIDVHGPNGSCPREAKKETAEEAKKDEAPKKEMTTEHVIPVVAEQEEKREEKQAVKEHVIPIEIERDEEQKPEPNPYANVIQALEAVQMADKANEAAAAVARVAEEATKASQEKQRSPSPRPDGWTFVDEEQKSDAGKDLGARPKSPLRAPPAPLHPDPLVASALETMLGMGFTNEGGWLAQLLEVKRGDIGKTLDVLQARYQQR